MATPSGYMPTSNAPYYRGLADARARFTESSRFAAEPVHKSAVVERVLSALSRKGAISRTELVSTIPSAPAFVVTDVINTLVESGICERLTLTGEDFAVRLTDRGMKLAS